MSTTLTDGVTTVTLPDDLLRTDEHAYSPVRQAVSNTLTGALWIDVSVAQAGEPITLAGGDEYGHMTRAEFAALRALADAAGQIYTLTFGGSAYQVMWRHESPPALDAYDLLDYSDKQPTDPVVPTLKFTRIS